ncbi:SGNH/GDSL hydrolase family protein [Devosia elaeis]|uniref:SGNH hydrolase-type esterase domain-containing protein n=1 Tax=Devosia elaeis TaxID=1770058 RepID=A0A178I319_9HYPH|nr:SGNH/GDSL hydrolase family protein [Devosia elaeis]OAM79972.1 hypothetical protein A3840_02475 [Devosia elaeis]
MTKTILVVGDSLTWGADPATKRRHPRAFQWPHVMQTGLGEGAEVVTEALCGRTTSFDDHAVLEERNAARSLPMLLSSHQPLSLVIIMLGTNDLKPHLCGLAQGAQAGLRRLVQLVRTHPYIDGAVPKILIVAPPPRIPTPARPEVSEETLNQSRLLAPLYRSVAETEAVWFFDAGTSSIPSMADGVHLDREQTQALGQTLSVHLRNKLAELSDY